MTVVRALLPPSAVSTRVLAFVLLALLLAGFLTRAAASETKPVPARLARGLHPGGMHAEDHMLYDLTDLTENARERVEKFLGDPRTSYVNIHSSGPGCYLCLVERL